MTTDTFPAALVEAGAEALWQAESLRAAGRPRLIAWPDVDERTKEGWRFMCRAALSALPAAVQAVACGEAVAVPRNGTEEAREEIARILEAVAKDGLPQPRDLDVALDAIFCTIAAQEPQR